MSPHEPIHACFAADYCVPTRSRSLEKLGAVAETVAARGLARLVDPGMLSIGQLIGLHDPDYVQAFLDGERPLAISQNLPWSAALRRAVLAMQAGQLTATELALQTGIAANIANGFHHAGPDRGGGFCTFNGLALIAHARTDLRVFVLDCDQHGGNGTEAFAAHLSNLYNYSIFGEPFGCQGGPRSTAHELPPDGPAGACYAPALEAAFARIEEWQPDLIVYQAGADSHINDPIGRGNATTADLYDRDWRVFAYCNRAGLPVLFTLAGGYQPSGRATELHVNTFVAARQARDTHPCTRIA